MVVLKSARWEDSTWTFGASDDPGGHYCVAVAIDGPRGSSACGQFEPDQSGFSWFPGGPPFTDGHSDPNLLVGPVAAAATSVDITLSNGTVVHAPAITPTSGLATNIAFFATVFPCGPSPVSVVARNRSGQIVSKTGPITPKLGLFHHPGARSASC